MNINGLDLMDREAAFPVYSYVVDGLASQYNVPTDYEPGRVIIAGHRDRSTCRIDDTLEDRLGPNDIVYVPLYIGECMGPNNTEVIPCDNTSYKLGCYEENLRFLERIAPRVKGILVGNAGPELSFKHLWRGDLITPRITLIEEMISFVDETSEIIKNFGGTPCYGPVDWDVALDCYFCDSRYRDRCNEIGAINIIFCGFQLFGLGKERPRVPSVPHESDVFFWTICPRKEVEPWPVLTDYISGYDEIISGLEFLAGLRRGNDVSLAEHGFDAGLCGGLMTNIVGSR